MSDERIVLITGASRGLGFAVGKALAAPNTHILAVARTMGGLEELDDIVSAAGGKTTLVPLDITNEVGLQSMGRAIHDRWGRLDLLIHCAADAAPLSPVGHIAEKDMDRAHAVNARATQRLITMLDPLLSAAPAGRAIIVDDPFAPGKFGAAYCASKAAARVIAENWAAEGVRTGPKVTLFQPEPMPTALRARFYPGEDRSSLSSTDKEAARLIATL